jgi:hypothetical protein
LLSYWLVSCGSYGFSTSGSALIRSVLCFSSLGTTVEIEKLYSGRVPSLHESM